MKRSTPGHYRLSLQLITIITLISGWHCAPANSADTLLENFRNPPAEARPFVRWWWMGNRLTKEEIVRELDLLKDAGVGGVEINPIAMPEPVQNPTGRELTWLSDEWNEMLNFTLDEAAKRDILTDLITGTGWPFGGEFLQPDETLNGLELAVIPLQGPGEFARTFPPPTGVNERLFQLTLFPAQPTNIDDGRDLTPQVQTDGSVAFSIPAGRHTLYAVTWRNNFRTVSFGAKGGAGPVLDHFAKEPVQKYLHRLSDALNPVLGGKLGDKLRAIFCDSIELEGANWTADFSQEFQRRRGYAIEPWLPFVLQRDRIGHALAAVEQANDQRGFAPPDSAFADAIRRVRYDWARTLAEVFTERFIVPFHEWANDNGALSRYQSYGHPWIYTDLLDGYLIPDIPEGDTWVYYQGRGLGVGVDQVRISTWPKYAASAGHLMGRRLIGSEAMTNTRGVFKTSLAYVKQATDLNFFAGANHTVFHGFNYSPPEAGFPGWVRFGTYFSEQNPWWPFVRDWTDYTARVSAVFQEAQPVSHVALMGPTPDVWSDNALVRGPFNQTPWYLHDAWHGVHKAGFSADYVNGTILQGATFDNGQLHFGPMSYDMLIVFETQTMEPETAEGILKFAAAGGRVAFIGRKPDRAPGLRDREKRDRAVRRAIDECFSKYHERVKIMRGPGPHRFEDGLETERQIQTWMHNLLGTFEMTAPIYMTPRDPRLYQIQLRDGDRDIFFFGNMDRKRDMVFYADYATVAAGKTPWRWDPETGDRAPYPTDNGDVVAIHLDPGETFLLVLEPGPPEAGTPVIEPPIIDRWDTIEIAAEWEAEFRHVNGATVTRIFSALPDIREIPELENFAGTIVYRATFDVADTDRLLLDIGEVYDISEVTLNGQDLGHRWWGWHTYDTGGALRTGENTLEITVTTVLYNYTRTLTDNPTTQHWFDWVTGGKEPVPAGLRGPVRLVKVL